ncbi:MAG: hypothetical protein GXO77_15470 [Calditrichaeota bacterium]|nr:hypothetical protein [Calditrichota bacterium]
MKSKKQNSKTLLDEIKKFRSHKYFWVAGLLLLGLSGLIIPILPGFLFIILALALIRPGWMAKIRKYLKKRSV